MAGHFVDSPSLVDFLDPPLTYSPNAPRSTDAPLTYPWSSPDHAQNSDPSSSPVDDQNSHPRSSSDIARSYDLRSCSDPARSHDRRPNPADAPARSIAVHPTVVDHSENSASEPFLSISGSYLIVRPCEDRVSFRSINVFGLRSNLRYLCCCRCRRSRHRSTALSF